MEAATDAAIAQRNNTALNWATANAQLIHPVRGRIAFVPYHYQADFLNDKAHRRIVLKARQVGYSQVFAVEALYTAITRAESTVLLVSRSQDLAANLLRYCYTAYNGLKDAPELTMENAGEMGLANGSRIKSIPANRSTGRGFAATDVYLDEFAYAAFADDIYQSVSPAVSQGGRITIASTPNGNGNKFYALWHGGDFSRHKIDWRQCPAYWTDGEKAQGIPPEKSKWYLEHRKNYTEQSWAAEYECDFTMSGGMVFRHVREASILQPAEPVQDGQYVIGVDWGRSNDSTVFSVINLVTKQQVAMDRMSDTDYASQRIRLKALADRYNNALIIAESNSMGQPNIEALQNMGCNVTGFTTTNATKANIIQQLELAFERGEIMLLDDEYQITELMAYQSEKLPSGLVRYGSPEGLHDDTVMALALAWNGTTLNTWVSFG